jgi:hypothetical protein
LPTDIFDDPPYRRTSRAKVPVKTFSFPACDSPSSRSSGISAATDEQPALDADQVRVTAHEPRRYGVAIVTTILPTGVIQPSKPSVSRPLTFIATAAP